jgi:NTP-dependent ternary system trypsin peptidase co-occuring protein
MAELLGFPMSGGGQVVVEVDDREPGFQLATKKGAIAEAKRHFEDSLAEVREAATAALRVFRDGELGLDGVEIEFGVRMNAEVGAVIAKSAVEGHLKVKLVWSA